MYKLTQGSCPKSYGTNVARLAGLPARLVERASQMAASLESNAQQDAGPGLDSNRTGCAVSHDSCLQHVKTVAKSLLQSGNNIEAELNKLQLGAKELLANEAY